MVTAAAGYMVTAAENSENSLNSPEKLNILRISENSDRKVKLMRKILKIRPDATRREQPSAPAYRWSVLAAAEGAT